jgi:hypothetical protein
MRRKILASFATLVLAVVLQPSAANASSDYDDIQAVTTLEVSHKWQSQECSLDVTYDWDKLFLETSTNSTYKNSFLEARENGAIGVSQGTNGYGGLTSAYPSDYPVYSGSGYKQNNVTIYWVEDSTGASLTWADDWVQASKPSSVWEVQLAFNESCGLYVAHVSSGLSNDVVGGFSQLFPYFSTFDVVYPSGYLGDYIPGAKPEPTPYTGTVDCGGVNPSLMTIAQAGNNGAATLTYVSEGISEWSYNLRTDVPYSFNVLCGTRFAAPFGVVSATTSSNLWTCDVVGPEPWYCVLS